MVRWKKRKAELPRRRQLSDERIAEETRQSAAGRALFKRNRTLTGSLSSSVSSATELSGDLRSPRAHVHHLVAHRRRLGSIFTMTLLAIIFLTWLLYEFTAGIQVTPVDSSVVLQQDRYKKALDDYFSIHPIERLRPLLNESQLNEYVGKVAPEVASLHAAGAAGFATSQFDIDLRKPVAGWLIGATQYYVDDKGIAFQLNYFDQPAVKISDQSGVPQTVGTAVASSRFLGFVGRAVVIAHDYGMTVEQAVIPAGTTRQVELKIAGHSYPAKLSLDRPVGEQIEDMQRAIAYLDSKKVSPRYIDVRVSGKAYYQ
jgi:hypothetical protein